MTNRAVTVTPQGATSQAFVQQAKRAAAVSAFVHVEEQKASKAREEATVRENGNISSKAHATAPNGSNVTRNGTPSVQHQQRERVVVVERSGSNNDYLNGVIAGQMMNRNHQGAGYNQNNTQGINPSSSGNISDFGSQPSARYTPLESTDGGVSFSGFIWTIVVLLLLACLTYGIVMYVKRRQAQAEHVPNYKL